MCLILQKSRYPMMVYVIRTDRAPVQNNIILNNNNYIEDCYAKKQFLYLKLGI